MFPYGEKKTACQFTVNVQRTECGLLSRNGLTGQLTLIVTGQITRMRLVMLAVNTGWATR